MKKKYMKLTLNPMNLTSVFRLLAVVLLSILHTWAMAQCNPDVTPPVSICDAYVYVDVSSGPQTVSPGDVNDGTYDNCTTFADLDFRLEEAPPSSSPPASTSLTYSASDIGEHIAVLWAIDQSGNWNYCATTLIVQDCTGNPPSNLACNALVEVTINPGETVVLYPEDVLEGGPYCLDPTEEFLMTLDPPATATPTLTLNESNAGTHIVQITLYDNGAPGNACWGELVVGGLSCDNDLTPPTCVPPADTAISIEAFEALGIDPENTAQMDNAFGSATATDNCEVDGILKTVNLEYQTCSGNTALQTITRSFTAYDTSGNFSPVVTQVISLLPEYTIEVPADFYPGDPQLDTLKVGQGMYALVGIAYEDVVYDFDCDGNTDKIVRTWSVVNWCDFDNDAPVQLPSLDLDADGNTGDAYDAIILGDSAYLYDNGVQGEGLAPRSEYYKYTQNIRYNYYDTIQFTLAGRVFLDTLSDCQFVDEPLLEGWPVRVVGTVSGKVYTTTSNINGQFLIDLCVADTLVEVSLDVPFNYGQSCPTTYTVPFTPGSNQIQIQNIPVQMDDECPLLTVDLAAPFLLRCFENYYAVSYLNLSDQLIAGAHVELELDPEMTFVSSTLPETAIGNNTYSFDLGDLQPGQYGSFQVNFDLDCDAEFGATHCSEAHIFPDTLCPPVGGWSGANIEVDGYCENDSIHLIVRNTGAGDMTEALDFIIVEDVIMYLEDNFELNATETEIVLHMPGNGATWRLEAEQEANHPYPGNIAIAVEGCNGVNETGLVNLFFLENPNPFIAVDCQENVGSYDPNDKTAFPAGYGDAHYIERGVDIEYRLRFQNTGTAPAINVVLLDTLSPHLDPETIRPGAGSHPFSFERIDGNVLRFTFADIMLPDSNTNEVASHGFVQFSAQQMPGLSLGTVIENQAAIYFDFNDPVLTNTTFHTIGENFIQVIDGTTEPWAPAPLNVYPNPSFGAVTFELPEGVPDGLRFVLYDQLGREVRREQVAGTLHQFERNALPNGVYFYSVEDSERRWYAGKIVLR